MDNNEIQLNNEYVIKDSTTGEIFIPVSINGNIVRFKNDAQCPVETFNNKFILKTTKAISEYKSYDLEDQDELIKLFTEPQQIDTTTLAQLENALAGNSVSSQRRSEPSVSFIKDEKGNQIMKKVYNESEFSESDLPEHRKMINNKLNKFHNDNYDNSISNSFSEINEYEKVKLSTKVKLSIDLELELPSPDHILVIRDMYEDNETDYLEYMINKYIYENILSDTDTINEILLAKVNEWLNTKIKTRKKPVNKTVLKKVIGAKKPKKSFEKKELITNKSENNSGTKLSAYYEKFDFSTIFMIDDDEQLDIIKIKLKSIESDKKQLKLSSHLKKLIEEYEN